MRNTHDIPICHSDPKAKNLSPTIKRLNYEIPRFTRNDNDTVVSPSFRQQLNGDLWKTQRKHANITKCNKLYKLYNMYKTYNIYKTLQNVTFVKFVANFTKIKFPKKCKKCCPMSKMDKWHKSLLKTGKDKRERLGYPLKTKRITRSRFKSRT